jgi:zinc/manganese transport system substrate-binding protein
MPPQPRRARARCAPLAGLAVLAVLALTAAGCATDPSHRAAGRAGVVPVVAAENVWGSLAGQLGGEHAQVTSIIDRPDADPHDYEPTAADGRAVATAELIIVNGVGYDTWAGKLAAAGTAGAVLDVGALLRVPAGGNPHRWYNPDDVRAVIDAITAGYQRADPADAAYFAYRHDALLGTGLRTYFDLIAEIRAGYAGTPIGASESIVAMLAPATGLDLVTPATFLTAISQGADPSAADKALIDRQITGKAIKVYVYNRQNATPDVQAQIALARAHGIPVTTITETLVPAGASFQDWQVAQLRVLRQALALGTGKQ